MSLALFEELGIKTNQLFINGEWVNATSGDFVEVLNPVNNEVIAEVAQASLEDGDKAVEAAHEAFKIWSKVSANERSQLMHKYADILQENLAKLAELETLELGKPLSETLGELQFTVGLIRFAAESARRIHGDIIAADHPQERLNINRVPYGVVLGITTWNAPPALFARKFGPSLVMGNTLIIKPSEQTPLTSIVMVELARRAGFPKGVVNLILGPGRKVGSHLIAHTNTDLISVTGGPVSGAAIAALAGQNLKPVRLELGGKAPFIVLEDANIDKAVDAAFTAKFAAAGTNCTANDRMYIHHKVYDEFVDKFIKKTNMLTIGHPMTNVNIGPRVNTSEAERLNTLIKNSFNDGTEQLTSIKLNGELFERGNWVSPTLFSVKDNNHILMREENFGPVLGLLKIHSYEEAISYANDTEFGLSAYVFSQNSRNLQLAIDNLNFGELFLNRTSGESIYGFHTGYGKSGIGGEDGIHGIDGYVKKKTSYLHYSF